MGQRLRYSVRCFLVAGSLLLASSVASASSAMGVQVAAPTTVASAGGNALQVEGDAQVEVPPALVGVSDGLANSLPLGKSYRIGVYVWLAAGQPRSRASVTVTGAQTQQCATAELVAARVVSMHCRIIPTLAAVRTGLVVTVTVEIHAAPEVSARFAHRVVAPDQRGRANPNVS
jgi:hypothetical protein